MLKLSIKEGLAIIMVIAHGVQTTTVGIIATTFTMETKAIIMATDGETRVTIPTVMIGAI